MNFNTCILFFAIILVTNFPIQLCLSFSGNLRSLFLEKLPNSWEVPSSTKIFISTVSFDFEALGVVHFYVLKSVVSTSQFQNTCFPMRFTSNQFVYFVISLTDFKLTQTCVLNLGYFARYVYQ